MPKRIHWLLILSVEVCGERHQGIILNEVVINDSISTQVSLSIVRTVHKCFTSLVNGKKGKKKHPDNRTAIHYNLRQLPVQGK